jgi:cell division transport system permease protein
MKSIKNHLSLIFALVSILFAVQSLIITDRAINAYKNKLTNSYSIVVVSDRKIDKKTLLPKNPLLKDVIEINIDGSIKKIDASISKKNMELLKLTLPNFYKITLKTYPSEDDMKKIKQILLKLDGVKKVEDFKENHNIIYRLLILFQTVVYVFSIVVFISTSLVIIKELRIWQYKHNERMNIMGLFGSPTWLSSAVLFRLAIVDAILSAIFIFFVFSYISTMPWLVSKINDIGINISIFDVSNDFLILLGASLILSILLAITIVFTHKEEV